MIELFFSHSLDFKLLKISVLMLTMHCYGFKMSSFHVVKKSQSCCLKIVMFSVSIQEFESSYVHRQTAFMSVMYSVRAQVFIVAWLKIPSSGTSAFLCCAHHL